MALCLGTQAKRPPVTAVLFLKFACLPVSHRRRVVVRTVMQRKGVTLTRIAVNGRVRLFCKRRLDLSLRRL
jgi:hypothetical protein